MKKFIIMCGILLLSGIGISKQVMAATGLSKCSNGCPAVGTVCCADRYPGTRYNCCASPSSCTTSCQLIVMDNCPSECPSTFTWTATTGNREAKCKSTVTGGCDYRCKSGYYNRGPGFGDPTGTLNCSVCPSNATCAAGSGLLSGETLPKCNQNYYGNKVSGIIPPSYFCTVCPSAVMHGAEQPGKTAGTGATSITQCFIPNGFIVDDDTGRFQVIGGHCYYSK